MQVGAGGRSGARALAVALALLVAAWCLREDAQPDLYFHLACGRWIVEHGLPRADPFLALSPPHPFVDHEWGFQVGAWAAHALGGPALLTLLKSVAVALALGLLLRGARAGLAGALLVVPLVLVGGGRFVLRPEVVTFLGVALHAWALAGPRPPTPRTAVGLLAFQALWTNAHGYALLGPALTGAALLGAWLAPRLPGWFPCGQPGIPCGQPGSSAQGALLRLLLAELLVTFANPAGPGAPLYPLLHLGKAAQGDELPIVELLSPFDPGLSGRVEVRLFRAWLLCAPLLVAAGLRARRLRPEAALMGLGLVAVGLPYVRHLALGAAGLFLLSGPGLLALLRGPLGGARARAALTWSGAALALLLGVLTLEGRFHESADYEARAGVGLAGFTAYPEASAALDAAGGAGGELWNTFGSGHWLIWAREGRAPRPFICGNLDLYPREHLALYHRMLRGEVDFTAECQRRGIGWALLDHRVEVPPALIEALARDPRWALVHADARAVLFRRAGPGVEPLDRAGFARQALEREREREARPEPLALRALRGLSLLPARGARPLGRLHLARLLLLLGRPAEALEAARGALLLAPEDWAPALAVAAEVERRAGDPARARALLERLAGLDPGAAGPWLELGQLELRGGRPREAARAFAAALLRGPAPAERRAAEENLLAAWEAARDPIELRRALAARPPGEPLGSFYAGAAALLEGELDRAAEGFQRALASDPGLLPAHQRLGEARFLGGDLAGAEAAYARWAEIAPSDASAWRDLGVVRQRRGDPGGALQAWERAAAVDPREVLALLYAAGLHRERGEAARARQLLRQVLTRDPDQAEARRLLGADRD